MSAQDFSTTILVDQTPEEAFQAVTNVRGWWSEEINGDTDRLDAVFNYRFEDVHHCQIRIAELVPDEKVVWSVLDNYFKFTEDEKEWTGTSMVFEIEKKGNQTQVTLTHVGLVPAYECYNICHDAWTFYIQDSLFNLITTGKGKPNATGKPQTEDEKKITSDLAD